MDIAYIIIILGIVIGFFVQTIIGFSAGLIALPILLIVLNIKDAVVINSIFLFLFSCLLVIKNRKFIEKKLVFQLSIFIIIGLILGVFILKIGNPIILKKILGVFIILYVGYNFLKKKKLPLLNKLGPLLGFIGGLFAGMFSSGGPSIVAYIYNKLKDPVTIRATIIGTLAITNLLRLPLLAVNNLVRIELLSRALWVLPFFILAIYLGQKVSNKVNKTVFKNILLVFLFLSGVALIIR